MVNKGNRYDDAGDVVDHDIEYVAVKFGHAALDVAAPRHGSVDTVDHQSGDEPEKGRFRVVVEHGDQAEQPHDDTTRRERVDAPADSRAMLRRGRERLLRQGHGGGPLLRWIRRAERDDWSSEAECIGG